MFGIQVALVLGILLLPLLGAIGARLLGQRGGGLPARWVGGGSFVLAIGCLVGLTQLPINATDLGRFAIFLPSSDVVIARDSMIALPTAAPTTILPSPTPRQRATNTPTAIPTGVPTPTEAATVTPAPTATAVPPPPTEAPPPPTAAPPPPTTAPRQAQRYVVEPGDTLRGIAERFDVSVDAILRYNGLSAEEGDSLRVGQELFIPPQ